MAKIGEHWAYKIYFDPEADTTNGEKYDNINDEDLMAKLKRLIGKNETINKVWTYKSDLTWWQITSFVFHHRFVVFQTDKWWWSIEKHSDGITIQRSNQFKSVVKLYRQKSRNFLTQLAEGEGNTDVYNLIEWLYFEDELSSKYHYLFNNCKHFADRVFEQVKNPVPYEKRFILDLNNTDAIDKENSRLTADEFLYRIMECEEIKEDINIIRMCSLWMQFRYFVVCETKTWLWCIEKTLNITIIYRFDSEKSLINRFRNKRSAINDYKCLEEDTGKMRMYDLMKWLYEKNDFIKRLYNENRPDIVRSSDVFYHATTIRRRSLNSDMSHGEGVHQSKAVTGHKWEYKIYFDSEAEVDYGDKYDIKEEELMTKLKQLVGVDEVFVNVWAYMAPLMAGESSPWLLFHIGFKTDGWWWSIEKHTDGITIQRSYFKTAVIDRYRRKNRLAVIDRYDQSEWKVLKEDIGKMNVHELIEWLHKEGELKKTYKLLDSDCKHFAKAVF